MPLGDQLFQAAQQVRKNAYAPYSQFHVGAALKIFGHEEIYTGCNVENASFGATICAERSATVKAVSELKDIRIEALALVTQTESFDTPCGMCLQFLSEFCDSKTQIFLCNLSGIKKTVLFSELMPFQFNNSLVTKSDNPN